MKIVDDPFDPVFVTSGPAPGRVELQIGERDGARFVRLRPEDARRVAQALLEAADEVERGQSRRT